MREHYFDTIEEFRTVCTANNLMKHALLEICPTRGNSFGFFVCLVLSGIIAIRGALSVNTIVLTSEILEILLEIELVLFGCIFTVYSILLAFLSDEYIKKLARILTDGKKSFLMESTSYYEAVLFLYFIIIGVTGVAMLICKNLPPFYTLTNNVALNNRVCFILLLCLYWFCFRIIYEVKSVIYNTIVLFRASIAYRFLAIEENDHDQDDE